MFTWATPGLYQAATAFQSYHPGFHMSGNTLPGCTMPSLYAPSVDSSDALTLVLRFACLDEHYLKSRSITILGGGNGEL